MVQEENEQKTQTFISLSIYTDASKHKIMFNSISRGKMQQNHNEIPLHSYQNGQNKK